MKNITIKNRKNQKLAVILHEPEKQTKKIIIIAHSFKGDKDYQPIMGEFSRFICGQGYSVIRFDCWGSGESDGKFEDSSIKTQINDLEDVIEYVKSLGYTDICLAGLSLGTTLSVMAYSQDIKCLLLWSPSFDHEGLYEKYKEDILRQGFVMRKRKLTGEEVKCGQAMWQDFKDIKAYKRLSLIHCPVLAIVGSDDLAEIGESTMRKYMDMIPADHKLEIISGGDHDFLLEFAREKAIALSSEFIKRYL